MTPLELVFAAARIGRRWPDAVIYPNPAYRNPGVPVGVLAVDVDSVRPHACDFSDDCYQCSGECHLVAWIGHDGEVHYVDETP